VREVLLAALAQVRHLQQVGEDEVAVEAQQRIAVEQHRRHAGDQHDVVQHGARDAGLGLEPQEQRERRDESLHQHSPGADHDALARLAECARRAGIDVRDRHEDEQHHAHVVHLAAPGARGAGVTELVRELHRREGEEQDQQVLRREHAVGEVLGELAPVRRRHHERRAHHHQPERRAGPAEKRPVPGEPALEPAVRIHQRDAQRERRELLHEVAAAHELRAAQELGDIGCHFDLQHVGAVQLAEEPDQLVLRRRVVAESGDGRVPELLDAARAVHQADDEIRRRIEAVHAARHAVLEHIPALAAIVVPVDADVAPQPGTQARHAVPR
jgi:hypothetical protein